MNRNNTTCTDSPKRHGRLIKKLLAISVALTVSNNNVLAEIQDEATLAIEEVIITARKRSESMQDVPVAVTAIAQSIVRDGNLDTMNEFLELVPNVSLPLDGWTSSDISIRGSGRISGDEDTGVGINRDGVYIGGLLTSFSNFYDVERFEVLRGPQAGLYGRNAVGGAINVYSVRPEFEQNGYLEVQLGSKEYQEYRGAANLTLVDDVLAIRVSGLFLDRDKGFGYVENQDQYLDAIENESARLRVLYTPSSDLEFLTSIETFSSDGGINVAVPGPGAATGELLAYGPVPGVSEDDTGSLQANFKQKIEWEQTQFTQEINWTLDAGTLTGIFSYRDTEALHDLDVDYTALDLRENHLDSNQQSTFAEIRYSGDFDKLHITSGITYLDEDLSLGIFSLLGAEFGVDFANWYTTGIIGADVVNLDLSPTLIGQSISELGLTPTLGNSGGWSGDLGDTFPANWTNDQKLESVAVFVELEYQFSDALQVWLNARYTEDTKEISFSQSVNNGCPIACNEVFIAQGLSVDLALNTDESWDNFSPAVGVNYTVTDDVMVYAKYVTGFKAGGFNRIASTVERIPFDSETTQAVELGLKSRWWDGRFQFNAATFYQEREDALVFIIDPDLPINTLGVNAGEIDVQGLEIEMMVLPAQGLTVNLSLGYLDSEFKTFEVDGDDFSGNRTPLVFKYTFSGVVNYERPLTDTMDLFTFVSYYAADDGYLWVENTHEMDRAETVDLRLGVKTETWKVSAFVDNVLDNRYISFEVHDPDRHYGIITPGRTYGVQAVYNF